jgi:hypothetical protein
LTGDPGSSSGFGPAGADHGIEAVHQDAVLLLNRMDALGLSQPGAYLSLAIETLTREYPQLPATPPPDFHHC